MTRDNIASSSRLEATPTPPPSRSRRRALRRRIHGSTVAFVLALTAPYLAAATPLPQQHPSSPGHDPHPQSSQSDGQSMVVGGLSLLQGALRVVSPVFSSYAGDTGGASNHPERRWARLDSINNLWHMPDGYVQLTQTMSPGFIVLSYLISLVGSWCTLELLIRRTSNRGLSNLFLLAAAGICFGAVSTFAMHFVGNQSLTLHHPAQLTDPDIPNIYLSYDGGFTVLSLVASCGAMTFAFFVMGTDIRVADWQSWCTPGDRKSRSDAASRRSRQDYNRWKVNKARLRKTANISTIFQQAGMMTSWSLMDAVGQRPSHHSWRDLLPWPRRKSVHEKVQDEYYAQAAGASGSPDMDEDMLIQQDKELSEIDFRYGRNAARDELDRRALMHNVDAPQSPSSLPSPTASHLQTQLVHQLPSSPLTTYYPANISGSSATPLFRTPSPQIDPSYSFPPRMHVDSDSTTNLLPRSDQLTAPPPIFHAPRRASVPTLQPAPPPRVAHTLSRIQSLPEPDGEGFTQPGGMYLDPENGKTGTVGSTSSKGCASSDSDTGDDYDHDDGMYHDLEDEDDMLVVHHGWRQRLRLKVQAGMPLTRLERAERFLGLDVVTWTEVFKIFVTGMVAGWGVAAMHYIGQVSITKIPYIAYRVGYVVGSVIIASGAVIIALYIMFIMLRPKLKHSWVSKSIVAVILAGAVCGMHYTGMMGTVYGWEAAVSPTDTASMSGTKRAITGVVAALAFVACLAVVAFIVINSVRDRKERARRRRVVVASVLIDDENRMLVSAIDGMLPMCDIASLTPANHKKRGSSGDASGLGVYLTTGNEAFIQAMKMSWSWRNAFWSSLNPFASQSDIAAGTSIHPASSVPVPSPSPIPMPPAPTPPYPRRGSQATMGQRRGSQATMEPRRGSQATTGAQSIGSTMTVPTRVNIARFLEMFAISATQLSARLTGQHEGLSRLGVLYDRILTTGWVRLDSGTDTVSKGQLIFLVRRVTSVQERSDLLSRHFIFADPSAVAMSLHKTLSTPYDLVLPFLEDMRQFCDRTMRMTLRPNTLYAGVAVVQATPHDGLRILLNNQKSRSQLPMREVCTFSTLPGLPVDVAEGLAGTLEEIGEAVTWLDGMSLLSVITRNMTPETYNVGGPRVGRLLASLERAVVPLLDELLSQDDMAYILPRLTLHPVLVPLTPASPVSPRAGSNGANGGWAAPHIIVFYANYDIAVNTFADKWLPFSLFRAQNECVMAGTVGKIARAAEASATSSSNGAASAAGSGGSRTPRQPSPSPAAASVALPASNPATSPTLSLSTASAASPDPAKYNPYTRRPSRVQFEMPQADPVPTFGNYSFPPKEGEVATTSTPPPTTGPLFPLPSSRDRQPPRRSSLAKSNYRDDPEKEVLLLPGGGAGAAGVAVAGIAQWDPNWLINLLRTRLRAET